MLLINSSPIIFFEIFILGPNAIDKISMSFHAHNSMSNNLVVFRYYIPICHIIFFHFLLMAIL